jgi:hypothetical protein
MHLETELFKYKRTLAEQRCEDSSERQFTARKDHEDQIIALKDEN